MDRCNAYSAYLKKRFDAAVLKVPLNAGFTCPNRDGRKGTGGCAFCDNRAFSPVAGAAATPLDQLTSAIERTADLRKVFIAYLQPFSNTYAPPDLLAGIYEPLLRLPRVVGLSIGTRPDCLPDPVYDYLADLTRRTYLTVELGLQTAHDATLARINRGHTVADFAGAAVRLSAAGIDCVAHVVLGLPGETGEMMLATASFLASLPVSGVKIHQLMVIRGTPIADWHQKGDAPVMTIEEYASILCGFIERLRPDQHIHRIMADSRPGNGLLAPEWSARKSASISYLRQCMEESDMVQGRRCRRTTP
jgi:radical SAM protein (TIGR01212 family)